MRKKQVKVYVGGIFLCSAFVPSARSLAWPACYVQACSLASFLDWPACYVLACSLAMSAMTIFISAYE